MPVIPVGKAEIILDPSRGASLTAEGAAIEHEDGESFRRGVDRRGKTGRSGPHYGNVVDPLRIDGPNQADTGRKLGLARIDADHRFAGESPEAEAHPRCRRGRR